MTLPGIWWSADPGVKYVAYALWADRKLASTGLVPLEGFEPFTPDTRHLIVLEKPQVYRHARARSADLVDLAISAGRIEGMFSRAVWYLPREWKGQVPKKIHHPRILAQLTDREKSCLPSKKGELKHILDAVGLGLYHMRAIGVKR